MFHFFGNVSGENRIQKAAVDVIIDSVVDALLQDPMRRFIYVEMAFFSKWWYDQDDEMKAQVRMLVNEGRLGIYTRRCVARPFSEFQKIESW